MSDTPLMQTDRLSPSQIAEHVENAFPSYSDVHALGKHIRVLEAIIAEWHAKYDALARTLATLAQEGIATGEDGAVRWHGLTGAEIEGMKEERGRMVRQFRFIRQDAVSDLRRLAPMTTFDGIVELCDAALAAAAGRGADAEAGA